MIYKFNKKKKMWRKIDYDSLHQIDSFTIQKKTKFTEKKVILLFPLILIFIFVLDYRIGIYFSIYLNIYIFLIKFVVDKMKNIQFSFLPPFELNKINNSQEKKQEAINNKITYFEETNPIRIMEDNNKKKYLLINTSFTY